jgi:hypothetical protein
MSFAALKIAKGEGKFHVNQFRIHFSIPGFIGEPKAQLPKLAGEFIKDFPRFFNGLEKNMKRNQASVAWSTKMFEGTRTLRFLFDLRSEKLGINLPDLHSDWTHVVWQNRGQGFSAQTLKRNFPEMADTLTLMLPRLVKAFFLDLNSYHFLAGRRSWIFGVLAPGLPGWNSPGFKTGKLEGGKFIDYSGKAPPVFFLESSAVERYSRLLFRLMEYDNGLLVDMRKAIVSIWSTLLANYVHAKGFRLNVVHPIVYQQDDGVKLWKTQPSSRGVYCRQAEFPRAQDLQREKWIHYLFDLHPALKSQPLSEIQFKGFGGGSFGGGGASSRW